MRIACVLIPHFPVAVERQRDPSLHGRPLVIGETPDQRKAVLDCSSEAEAQGARVGMPLRQALALCREAVFLPPHPSRYSDVFDSLIEVLETFSPEVEQSSLGRAYLNAAGLARHYEGELDLGERIIRSLREATGLVAGVGVAEGKFVAWAAARHQRAGPGLHSARRQRGRIPPAPRRLPPARLVRYASTPRPLRPARHRRSRVPFARALASAVRQRRQATLAALSRHRRRTATPASPRRGAERDACASRPPPSASKPSSSPAAGC